MDLSPCHRCPRVTDYHARKNIKYYRICCDDNCIIRKKTQV